MSRKHMRGVYVVEFALVGLLLFILLLGVLEFGRLLFTVNTLEESVRRGARLAVVCNIQDPVILQRAVFAEAGGTASSIIGNLDSAHLTLRYLDEDGAEITGLSGALPSVSVADFQRIRFVEVRIDNFPFNLLVPIVGGGIVLQTFRSVLPRESLGRYPEGSEITKC